jgi:hypothetical protein
MPERYVVVEAGGAATCGHDAHGLADALECWQRTVRRDPTAWVAAWPQPQERTDG